MNLYFDKKLAQGYTSKAQIARILTENWVLYNSYCPKCGSVPLSEFENNRPVADFYCQNCYEEFELKSKNGRLPSVVTDGAYTTMIERINADNNPNFFFLTYDKQWRVNDFLIIPKQFFTTNIIIKRKPLSANARRAGWVGCNIDISNIADFGKIFLVKNSQIVNQNLVKEQFNQTLFIRTKSIEARGWLLDIMVCVDSIPKEIFTLNDVYAFEYSLKEKHPSNNFIKDKIRQQLQLLRDKGLIEFVARGQYRKIKNASLSNTN